MTRPHTVTTFEDEALGNNCFLLERDDIAVAIDPPRDVGRLLDVIEQRGLTLSAVLETHLHADFVGGARELHAATGAEICMPRAAELSFAHRAVDPDEVLTFGDVSVKVIATPGHAPEAVSYVIDDRALFSGGSLIVGGAARTDLVTPERTEELARAQFRSLRVLASLPPETDVYPTHGSSSFCSSGGPPGDATTTIARERETNTLFRIEHEEAFVNTLLEGFGSYPTYFRELREVNQRGPRLVAELTPPRALDPIEVAHDAARGAWLIDARPVEAWAAAHPKGSSYIRANESFATWLGWLVPFDAPVIVLVDDDERDTVVTLARRIGYDHVAGWIEGGIGAWTAAGLPVQTMALIDPADAEDRGVAFLDVRQRSEWKSGIIPSAERIELGDILAGEVPRAREVIVYCASGRRSSTAAGLLARRGVKASVLRGGITAWLAAGLPVSGDAPSV